MPSAYIKRKFKNVINITEIVTIHYYEFDKNFIFQGESHDFWEIVYVDSGTVEIVRDGEAILLRQGEIVFHKPNEFHSIKSYHSSPNFFVITFVSKSSMMRYFEKFKGVLNIHLKPLISSIIREAESTYIIPQNDTRLRKMERKSMAQIGGEQLIKIYLEQFLIILIRDLTQKKDISFFPSKESMETHLVSQIKAYIKSKSRERLRVEEICSSFGYSKSYISQLFKEQTALSLARYHNQCQIEEAKRLIREGQNNFSQISDLLSFDNPQYFSRVFKRLTGLTPSEFQQSLDVRE